MVNISENVSLIDSTIVAAIVSAIISFVILIISNFIIQPRRWRQDIQLQNLEKRLEVYGALLTILKSLAEKGKRQSKGNQDTKYRMELPFDYTRMTEIFEKYDYLLSDDIAKSWLEFLQGDTFFSIYYSLKDGGGMLSGVDFTMMQELVETEYKILKEQYYKLTGIRL